MTLLREAFEIHRTGAVDDRRRWVLRHPTSSSVAVSLLATLVVTGFVLLLRPASVTLVAVIVLFGISFGASLLLLAVAGLRPDRPGRS